MDWSEREVALVVGRGGHGDGGDDGLAALTRSVAERLPGLTVRHAVLSDGVETLTGRVAAWLGEGGRRMALLPYLLEGDGEVEALAAGWRERFPEATFTALPSVRGDPALAELVVDRLSPFAPARRHGLDGAEIERRSHDVVAAAAGRWLPEDALERAAALRVAHATGDPAFVRRLLFRPGALAAGLAALREGRGVFCDARMLVAGLTRLPSPPVCLIDHPDTVAAARSHGGTRAAEAVTAGRETWSGGVLVVGNAPTALWRMLDMVASGTPPPALTVGLPVGFIGARESKQQLWESGLPCVTNIGPRGGTAAAAAVVNALCRAL